MPEETPVAILFKEEQSDSVSVIVEAQPLTEKVMWAGIFFPFFPTFYLPKTNYYKSQPNTLIIYLHIFTKKEILVNCDSISINYNDKIFYSEMTYIEKWVDNFNYETWIENNKTHFTLKPSEKELHYCIELKFPISAMHVEKFKLNIEGLFVDKKIFLIPEIEFIKLKRKFHYNLIKKGHNISSRKHARFTPPH